MKIKHLYELHQGLGAIANKELPIKTAFSIQQNLTKVEVEVKNAETIRQKIIKKYTDEEATRKLKEPGKVQLKADKLEDCSRELNELMEQEIGIKLKKIKIDDLDGLTVKPITLNQLRHILAENKSDEPCRWPVEQARQIAEAAENDQLRRN